ncbi:hypothetical protein [Marinobacterium litorale]|uniref:hypothetical protein n=1 Tax=Marinobacterium litorale TaxID=404770 RepID=UPI0004827873|nr:hypothetical protein [Marinobacterium litorale]
MKTNETISNLIIKRFLHLWSHAAIKIRGDDGTDTEVTMTELASLATADRLVSVSDEAAYTALVANSGKPHTLPNLTASCTISLPAAAVGLEYEFIYKGVAADAQNWVIDTGSDTNFFLGGLAHLDTDAGSGGDEVVPIAGDGDSNSKLTVVTPDVGTRIKAICDGTNWVLSGYVVSATVPSFADQ